LAVYRKEYFGKPFRLAFQARMLSSFIALLVNSC
jgi:hypothetical protein